MLLSSKMVRRELTRILRNDGALDCLDEFQVSCRENSDQSITLGFDDQEITLSKHDLGQSLDYCSAKLINCFISRTSFQRALANNISALYGAI